MHDITQESINLLKTKSLSVNTYLIELSMESNYVQSCSKHSVQ